MPLADPDMVLMMNPVRVRNRVTRPEGGWVQHASDRPQRLAGAFGTLGNRVQEANRV